MKKTCHKIFIPNLSFFVLFLVFVGGVETSFWLFRFSLNLTKVVCLKIVAGCDFETKEGLCDKPEKSPRSGNLNRFAAYVFSKLKLFSFLIETQEKSIKLDSSLTNRNFLTAT